MVVSNTSPISYLVLIGEIDLLPKLFETVTIPIAVRDELLHPDAPELVKAWIAVPPAWLNLHETPQISDEQLDRLHAGEKAAIVLAEQHAAKLLISDVTTLAQSKNATADNTKNGWYLPPNVIG